MLKTNFIESNVVVEMVKDLKKGAYYRLGYESNAKPLKRAKNENADIRKQTIVVARFGIEYQNIAINKDRQTGPMLNGAYYAENDYTYIVTQQNGNKQLVAYVNQILETKYYFNGVEVEKQWLIDNEYISSAKPKPNDNPTHRIQPSIEKIFELGLIKA